MTSPHPFRVLIANGEILRRTRELADLISRDFRGEPPMLIAVIDGARTFARHLQRHLARGCVVHELRASSYGAGTVSAGKVEIAPTSGLKVGGREVLLIEDIVDTGQTVATLRERLLDEGALACRVATLLSKPARRVVDVQLEYVGFEIPDEFVIGFGMDYAGRYREIEEVVVYESDRAAAYGL